MQHLTIAASAVQFTTMKGNYSQFYDVMTVNHNDNIYHCSVVSHFQKPELARSINQDWHKQPGCQSQPFFSIPLENVILDELHLLLRVTDRFEEGIIMEMLKWDKVNNMSI